jgi:hypothetical protein
LRFSGNTVPQEIQDAERCNRHGVRPERAVAEGNQLNAAGLRRLPFPLVPSAFRTHNDGSIRGYCLAAKDRQRLCLHFGARLDEHQPHGGGRLFEIGLEGQRRADLGQHGAPRLLDGCKRNTTPPIEAGATQDRGDRQFRTPRNHRLNG